VPTNSRQLKFARPFTSLLAFSARHPRLNRLRRNRVAPFRKS
jgi:hypothetical protein